MADRIHFSDTRSRYGFLSNRSPSPFSLGEDPGQWLTAEHYYQAMRTNDPERRKLIKNSPSAAGAILLGQDALTVVRPDLYDPVTDTANLNTLRDYLDLEEITTEDIVMLDALVAKFKQNIPLAQKLKATAPRQIQADIPDDRWGGDDNMLGKMLVYVRDVVISLSNTAEE